MLHGYMTTLDSVHPSDNNPSSSESIPVKQTQSQNGLKAFPSACLLVLVSWLLSYWASLSSQMSQSTCTSGEEWYCPNLRIRTGRPTTIVWSLQGTYWITCWFIPLWLKLRFVLCLGSGWTQSSSCRGFWWSSLHKTCFMVLSVTQQSHLHTFACMEHLLLGQILTCNESFQLCLYQLLHDMRCFVRTYIFHMPPRDVFGHTHIYISPWLFYECWH